MQVLENSPEIEQAIQWVGGLSNIELYGDTVCWIPYTHKAAQEWFDEFIQERFINFGTYEDALSVQHNRIYHSAISSLINVGLLDVEQVLDSVLAQVIFLIIQIKYLPIFGQERQGLTQLIMQLEKHSSMVIIITLTD